MFDILFSLDCGVRRFKNFEVNQLVDPVLRGVARNEVIPVLMDPPDKVVCYANIQCTAGATGEDIDVVLFQNRAFLSALRGHDGCKGPTMGALWGQARR
jgi:hypothetical protein